MVIVSADCSSLAVQMGGFWVDGGREKEGFTAETTAN